MLVYRWSTVYDVGPTLNHHWFNVLCLLGSTSLYLLPELRGNLENTFDSRTDRRRLGAGLWSPWLVLSWPMMSWTASWRAVTPLQPVASSSRSYWLVSESPARGKVKSSILKKSQITQLCFLALLALWLPITPIIVFIHLHAKLSWLEVVTRYRGQQVQVALKILIFV